MGATSAAHMDGVGHAGLRPCQGGRPPAVPTARGRLRSDTRAPGTPTVKEQTPWVAWSRPPSAWWCRSVSSAAPGGVVTALRPKVRAWVTPVCHRAGWDPALTPGSGSSSQMASVGKVPESGMWGRRQHVLRSRGTGGLEWGARPGAPSAVLAGLCGLVPVVHAPGARPLLGSFPPGRGSSLQVPPGQLCCWDSCGFRGTAPALDVVVGSVSPPARQRLL